MAQKKQISTDIFTFENLIEAGALYVDKTQYFYKLVSGVGKCYFCSRPRRFGKSLAISIFKNIFLGKKELFNGLYIASTDYDWQTYPVIHIDMARIGCMSSENLFDDLMDCMETHAKKYDVEITAKTPGLYFDKLISALREKTGKKVVILIDEYDRPLTKHIEDAENIEKIRNVLEEFYQIIKGQEPNERFVFMTGVTKFNKVSIFSKLNNLTDITMRYDYACMFGYTQEELEKNFAAHIDEYVQQENLDKALFIAKIKKWYDGFKFDDEAETVYNPVSVGEFFNNHCKFHNYWFATGTPTLLVNLARKHQLTLQDIKEASVSELGLDSFFIEDLTKGNVSKDKLIQLLLQTGYLTIDSLRTLGGRRIYNLCYPNKEVKDAFEQILLELYCDIKTDSVFSYADKVYRAVNAGDTARMIELIQNMLSQIPYGIQLRDEKYYQSLFYLFFKMCGMEISAESETNTGRIDAVMETENSVSIFELKLNKSAEKASAQIENKKYFQPFIEKARDKGQQIRCVGINFCDDKEIRNINDWVEVVEDSSSEQKQ